jgi:hypothetical protein
MVTVSPRATVDLSSDRLTLIPSGAALRAGVGPQSGDCCGALVVVVPVPPEEVAPPGLDVEGVVRWGGFEDVAPAGPDKLT